jgi:nucleoside-diphosphate-sugar epimerase
MTRALIGATGFVGSNLLRQTTFDALYHSRNIEEVRGHSFDLVVCAGARAEKWKANQDPEVDRRNLRLLTDNLLQARVKRLVLISTVDVFGTPLGVDEDTPVDLDSATPYGRHRYELERVLSAHFDAVVVRLPGLFGPGLRKNVVYDLLHDNQVDRINPAAVYQYYNLDHLWRDLGVVLAHGLKLAHFATEPLATRVVLAEVFGRALPEVPGPAPAYDLRSRHAGLFGGSGAYLHSGAQVLAELRGFVARERGGKAA